jgi:membrane associated rhomboid family serine protease
MDARIIDISEAEKKGTKRNFPFREYIFPILFVAALWLIKFIEVYFNIDFTKYGIFPRNMEGMAGIILYPLIHGNYTHLINNSLPLLVLGLIIFHFYKKIAFNIWAGTWLMSGLWIWSAARPAWHIGASGLIYGFGSFIFFSGIIRKNMRLLALSFVVVFLYGGMVWGIFPMKEQISWEGHLFGAIAGFILAVYYRKQGPEDEKYSWDFEDEENENSIHTNAEDNEATDKSSEETGNNTAKIVYIYKPEEKQKSSPKSDL